MNSDVKIIVIGGTQTGKTTICRIIKKALEDQSIPIKFVDQDDNLIGKSIDRDMLSNLQTGNPIIINEVNV